MTPKIIGVYAPDSKIPNLPLMKISAFYKSLGYNVEFYSPLGEYERVYISKVFKDSHINYYPKDMCIIGGSGSKSGSELLPEMEHIYPDYSLYGIDYAMGFITRGCNNNCPFCIVSKKEGRLHKHTELEEFWRGQTNLMLLDNSLTEYEHADIELQKIIDYKIHLNLCQGFNVRTIKPHIAELLAQIKLWEGKQWHIAWDNIKDEDRFIKGVGILNDAGIKNYRLMCYVLIGFNSTPKEDLYRVMKLREMKIDPFIMPYKKDNYCRRFARWVNHKAIFKTCTFEEYKQ